MKRTLAGLCFLAISTGMLAWVVPASQVPHEMWFFVYLMLAAIGLFSWRHSSAPTEPRGWLALAVAAAALGGVLAGVESFIFGPKSGVVLLDVLAASVGVLVACSGAVCAAAQRGHS